MKRVLLIFLSLVLVLVGWSAVCADDGFYVIPTMKGNYAPVPKTGQTVSAAPGDDGDLEKGVASPTPRFTDNKNGTVTDKLTGLIWMKDAGIIGQQTWDDALGIANILEADLYGLTDGSVKGDWRLPNRKEIESLVDCGRFNLALPAVNPFTNVQPSSYWSSSTLADYPNHAWYVIFNGGSVNASDKSNANYVWPVRGGK